MNFRGGESNMLIADPRAPDSPVSSCVPDLTFPDLCAFPEPQYA
ncbi:MAG: hypothetical protein AVDCRST_MAG91-3202 [uncultured Sphingomonadaceae bacterium]|uniref:Uncharacterized protein n=1 Tax=uncultured Sphingomonadaceae bacterium TaxID=169976 RepID=A0A6J4TW58_9SPHN|nr:MAG: hypothetical protein AVDCRST_MAG91-3202 [uncultured Sphingomonadaceae bacterium]